MDVVKLNLGCGNNHKQGYINVDMFGEPDVKHDLECFPWPWQDSSVQEIVLNHVLEHLGQATQTYLDIIKEIYRISTDQAQIHIVVPHPRHDDFLGDPTHVRTITPEGMALFSKRNNKMWIDGGFANTPLGIYLDIDFEMTHLSMTPDSLWAQRLDNKLITGKEFEAAARQYNNVVKEYRMVFTIIKPMN